MIQIPERYLALAAMIVVFISLGVLYNTATPIFEASDERWHYPYVRHLARGNGLPIQDPTNPQDWRQEGSQPPLFYVLGALATFWIDTSDYEEVGWENPHAHIGIPGTQSNINMFVHTDRESFPYQGTTLAVHIVRLVSLLFGAGAVAVTYLLALEIFPDRKSLAALATIFHAFNPMFLFISASVANDALITILSSLAVWMLVRLLKYGITDRRLVALGVIWGLAALTKLSGLALGGLILVSLAYLAYQKRSTGVFVRSILLVGLPALLIAGWWYGRNFLLYHDPTGLNVMLAIAGGRATPASLEDLLLEAQGAWMAYWSVFGGFNILSLPLFYWIFAVLTLFGLAGLVVLPTHRGTIRRAREGKYLALVALWTFVLFVALLRWTSLTLGSSGRLLFPGISAISLFLALGWSGLGQGHFDRWLAIGWGGTLGSVVLLTPFLVIAPAYVRPRVLTDVDLPAMVTRVDATYGGALRLLGYELNRQTLRVGDSARVTLWWQAVAPMSEDYSVSIKVFGPEDRVYGTLDTYPGLGTFPTSLWKVGDAIAETYAIPITEEVSYPSAGRFDVVVYQYPSFEKLEAIDPQGNVVGRVFAGRVKLVPSRMSSYQIANPVEFTLGDKVALIGYELEPNSIQAGQIINLTLYWKALATLDQDYTVFVHLVDAQGQIWGQKDNQPVKGEYPTSLWEPGEIIRDTYPLTLDPTIPPGEYQLLVGMYLPESGQRLPLYDPTGDLVRDAITLETIKIE